MQRTILVLIERRIARQFPELTAAQVAGAVKYAEESMRETRNELHDHVWLTELSRMTGPHLRYRIKALRSLQVRDFIYNYEAFTLFPFCSIPALPESYRSCYRQSL